MRITKVVLEDGAVSSAIGVVLMVAVTVILAAAVGAFALGLAEESAKKTPSASVETKWGTAKAGGTTYDTVDITMLGGDGMQSKYVTVAKADGTIIWEGGSPNSPYTTYGSKTWDSSKIQSGDTLGINETNTGAFTEGDTVTVIWDNGQKSQVLGTGTLQ
ncbi:type IV pilin [Halorubellus sp. JP-L1]|uniref:type IV pilin n=1 Tax=Halorubellus sp. JP-L1 TaxID=2715753 RepID=UPI00140A7914|nr:type IV pilin N-terminal domain-containing protein [Halorubellus sp. JP-L1]NHN41236.1 type IV pilin [Halorubellus sp. JP-L1]